MADDALARGRRALTLLVTLLLLAVGGCSPPDAPPPAVSSSGATPGDPGVVVALDDFAALTMLALGVTPDLAYDTFGYATTAEIFAAAGVQATPYGASLNLEQLAAARPDVMVGVSLPTTLEQQARLEQLGSVTILDYQADWQTALSATARALGREDRARRVEEYVTANTAALRQDLATANQAGTVVSVLAGSTDGPFSPPADTNLGRLLTSLGLDRPAAQKATVSGSAPFVNVSSETLDDHDGDALYVMAGRTYPDDRLKRSPLYATLEAVRQECAFDVSGEMWFGANPVSVQWVLDDLRATLLGGGRPQPEETAAARLGDLVSATS